MNNLSLDELDEYFKIYFQVVSGLHDINFPVSKYKQI